MHLDGAKPTQDQKVGVATDKQALSQYYARGFTSIDCIGREIVYGQDLKQQSWNTIDDLERYAKMLRLGHGKTLLDLGCGYAGPALYLAERTGCGLIGMDLNRAALEDAAVEARNKKLTSEPTFHIADLNQPLDLVAKSVDAILINDVICHVERRRELLAECARVLRAQGRIIITDPCVVCGPVANTEVALRNMKVCYYYSPKDFTSECLRSVGLQVLEEQNQSKQLSDLAKKWLDFYSNESIQETFLKEHGREEFDRTIDQMRCVYNTSQTGRLVRYLVLAEKAGQS